MSAPVGSRPPAPVWGELGSRWSPEGRAARRARLSAAGAPARAAAFVVVAGAIGAVAAAGGIGGWGLAAVVALAVGVAVSSTGVVEEATLAVPGAVVALLVLAVVLLFAAALEVAALGAVALLAAIACVGADWAWVERLRPLLLVAGAAVVLVVLAQEPWTYPVVLGWSVAALVAASLLERDRRGALDAVASVDPGGPPPVARADLASTLVVAVALALVAALVLSVPSCEGGLGGPRGATAPDAGGGGVGGDPGGVGGPGSVGGGSGTSGGGARPGPGGESTRTYVPDPDGGFLVPSDGASGPGSRVPVPAPWIQDRLNGGAGAVGRVDGPFGRWESAEDGSYLVTVEEPDGLVRYRLTERPDGLTDIERLGPGGETIERWVYDPDGELVDADAETGEAPDRDGSPQPDDEDGGGLPWWAIALAAVAVVAAGTAVWWFLRRPSPAPPGPEDAPPWARRLLARMEEEGAARGRPRRRDETVVGYGAALAGGPWPDPRLGALGDGLSAVLYGRGDAPGGADRATLEALLDGSVESHPRPGRGARAGRSRLSEVPGGR
ncbi:MAG: hypothetical protein KDA98_17110 [Acidimicrobiales bacterium]|nr:hypothetical protein [Acidimicrobiales bacterium]